MNKGSLDNHQKIIPRSVQLSIISSSQTVTRKRIEATLYVLSSKSEKFRLNCFAVGRSRTKFTSGPDYPDLWLKISRGVTRLILHYSLNWFHPWCWRTHTLKLVLYIVQVHCNACLIWRRLRSFIKEFQISMVCSNINTGVSGKYSNKHVYTRQLNLKQEA